MINSVLSRVNSSFNGRKGKVFCIVWWLVMKSGYTIDNHKWGKPSHASTSSAKSNIHGSKLLHCIWWDQLCVVIMRSSNGLKPSREISIDCNWYVFTWAMKKKRPLYEQRHDKVILQNDNAKPHVAKQVKIYLETLICIHQILLGPIITCSDQWHMAWLSGTFILTKMTKVESTRG